MKKKLSTLPSPAIAGVVREKNARAALAEIKNCICDGANMIDLHLSRLENTETGYLKNLIASSPLPILALNYNSTYDQQDALFSEDERIASLLRAIDAGADGIDLQGYSFHLPSKSAFCGEDSYSFTKGNPKEIVTDKSIIDKQCEVIECVHHKGAEVLLSCHPGIYMNSRQVVELALFLEQRNPDIIKIVTVATNDDQLIESFKTMLALKKEVKTPIAYHACGKAGLISRILNPMLGGHIAFCVDHFNESSTLEQLDLRSARAIIDNLKKIV